MNNPKFSIITPSYNCAPFLKDCIESVLAQNYENFEHIIVDGASTDNTVEILKSYPHLKWISEPDNGEVEALNKALKMVTGDILCWLNTDDYILKGAFEEVLANIDPDRGVHVVYGRTRILDENDEFSWEKNPRPNMSLAWLVRLWRHHTMPHQPSMYFTRTVIDTVGEYDAQLTYAIDSEMWMRMRAKFPFKKINKVLSIARLERPGAKSQGDVQLQVDAFEEIKRPYFEMLGPFQKASYYLDYAFFHTSQLLFGRIRYALKIRTRLQRLRDLILKREYRY